MTGIFQAFRTRETETNNCHFPCQSPTGSGDVIFAPGVSGRKGGGGRMAKDEGGREEEGREEGKRGGGSREKGEKCGESRQEGERGEGGREEGERG